MSNADELTAATLDEVAAAERGISLIGPIAFLSAETLASRLAARGEIDSAISILEAWGGRRVRIDITPHVVIFWTRNRLLLSELLRDRDPARAPEIRLELSQMLEFADEDHYVARAVRGL